jgi:hypothetical protein
MFLLEHAANRIFVDKTLKSRVTLHKKILVPKSPTLVGFLYIKKTRIRNLKGSVYREQGTATKRSITQRLCHLT